MKFFNIAGPIQPADHYYLLMPLSMSISKHKGNHGLSTHLAIMSHLDWSLTAVGRLQKR